MTNQASRSGARTDTIFDQIGDAVKLRSRPSRPDRVPEELLREGLPLPIVAFDTLGNDLIEAEVASVFDQAALAVSS
jgi:hypothetical protein